MSKPLDLGDVMTPRMIYIGIDIAKATFVATAIHSPTETIFYGETFQNTAAGFKRFKKRLTACQIEPTDCLIVMEATGVYVEQLCHFLFGHHFKVHVEPAKKVKDAFQSRQKTDPVDSRQIAEYGYRFRDKLHPWTPRDPLLDQLAALLSLREALNKPKNASKNTRKALQGKHVTCESALDIHRQMIQQTKALITSTEQEMKALLQTNPGMYQQVHYVMQIPGVGLLFAVNLLVITDGYTHYIDAKDLASFIGIAPMAYKSGTSVNRPDRTDKHGPKRIRKLLYLASMSLCEHNEEMKRFYVRQLAIGKPKKVALNKIAHKLLRIICAVIRENRPYLEKYHSVNPQLF